MWEPKSAAKSQVESLTSKRGTQSTSKQVRCHPIPTKSGGSDRKVFFVNLAYEEIKCKMSSHIFPLLWNQPADSMRFITTKKKHVFNRVHCSETLAKRKGTAGTRGIHIKRRLLCSSCHPFRRRFSHWGELHASPVGPPLNDGCRGAKPSWSNPGPWLHESLNQERYWDT